MDRTHLDTELIDLTKNGACPPNPPTHAQRWTPFLLIVALAAAFVKDNSMPEGRYKNHRVEVELIYVTSLSN